MPSYALVSKKKSYLETLAFNFKYIVRYFKKMKFSYKESTMYNLLFTRFHNYEGVTEQYISEHNNNNNNVES
jgi:hypothetical protein